MGVDTGISCCAGQVLVLAVRYMLMSLRVAVFLCKAKVNYIHKVTLLAKTHEEVVGLDITMDEILRVDVLYTTYLQSKWYN